MASTERNLLVGMIALQMELVQQDQLVTAFQTWMLHRDQLIEDILIQQGAIKEDGRSFVSAIAAKYLELHQDDAELSLASLSSISSLRHKLAAIGDDEIEKTLDSVGKKREERQGQETKPFPGEPIPNSLQDSRRFRILRPHAKGGLGEVSIAEDLELHREVALKQIQPRFRTDPESRSRFMVEAEITGRLEHPGIVPVYSLGTTEFGKPFYAMRFIHGHSLRQEIRDLHRSDRPALDPNEFRLAIRKLLRRFIDVCNAIEYAHSRGVLHRDLKPGNIMLGKYGETLVVDWGLAKTIGKTEQYQQVEEPTVVPQSSEGSSRTRMGTVVGTLAFMSPEQANGRVDLLGPTSDVYCLGATLYDILTGTPPIDRADDTIMLEAIREGNIVRPMNRNVQIPPALDAICMKALSKQQENRYPSAAALADDVELWLADEPASAYREPLGVRLGRYVRKHQTLVATVFVSMFIGTIALLAINSLVTVQNKNLRVARDAEATQRAAAELAEAKSVSHRDLAVDLSFKLLYDAERKLKNTPDTLQFRTNMMDQAYDKLSKLLAENFSSAELKHHLSRAARLSGMQKARAKNYKEAIVRMQRSIELQEELLPQGSNEDLDYLGETYRDFASLYKTSGDFSESLKWYLKSQQVANDLTLAEPGSIAFKKSKAIAELGLAGLYYEKLELEKSLALIEPTASTLRTFSDADTVEDTDRVMASFAFTQHSKILVRLGRGPDAQTMNRDILELCSNWCEKFEKDFSLKNGYGRLVLSHLMARPTSNEPTDEELNLASAALNILQPIIGKSNASYDLTFAELQSERGLLYFGRNELDQAKEDLDSAVTRARSLQQKADLPDFNEGLAKVLRNRAILHRAQDEMNEFKSCLEEALRFGANACLQSPENKRLESDVNLIRQITQ